MYSLEQKGTNSDKMIMSLRKEGEEKIRNASDLVGRCLPFPFPSRQDPFERRYFRRQPIDLRIRLRDLS